MVAIITSDKSEPRAAVASDNPGRMWSWTELPTTVWSGSRICISTCPRVLADAAAHSGLGCDRGDGDDRRGNGCHVVCMSAIAYGNATVCDTVAEVKRIGNALLSAAGPTALPIDVMLFRSKQHSRSLVMNKDQMQGWIREVTGKLRTSLGKTIGNRTVTWRGRVERVIGKTQTSYGDAKARLRKRS